MENKYNRNTSIRLDPEIKGWLYARCNKENRSLSNLINTILKKEKAGLFMGDVEFNISGQALKGILSRGDNNDMK